MRKIAIVLCVVAMLASFLIVGTAYAKTSGNGNGLDEWVTGGCKIFMYAGTEGPFPYTFAGTVGITSNGDFRGHIVVIDRASDVIWQCSDFSSVDIVGNVATFTGNYINNLGDPLEVTMYITDNGEPGVADRAEGYNVYGSFGGVIDAGNFQVHSK
jgi:hypothetical protein